MASGSSIRVADLVGVIEAPGLESPILLGHSMGGDTVGAAAARHPDPPRTVVMDEPGAMLGGPPDEDGSVSDWARQSLDRWQTHARAGLLETDEELASLPADARVRVSRAIVAVFEQPSVEPGETYPDVEAPTS